MRHRFFAKAFTPSVRKEQARHGSLAAYARLADSDGSVVGGELTEQEIDFIGERDSFYLGTVSETGWPHVQHRGGPRGFVRILDGRTLAWADYAGNRQYISIGNGAANDRVALIFVDYPARRRLKVLGRMKTFEVEDASDLMGRLQAPGYDARVEHAVVVAIEACDWNCPQHITPRFTFEEVEASVAPLKRQIVELQARLGEPPGDE